MKKVEKVIAYIVHDRKLLVFIHATDKSPIAESGLQVPAGTCKSGEAPDVAVLREAREETGLEDLRIVKYLGDSEYDIRPYADEIHNRHFFQLATDGEIASEWMHKEDTSNLTFKFNWLPIERAHVLAAGQGALLSQIDI